MTKLKYGSLCRQIPSLLNKVDCVSHDIREFLNDTGLQSLCFPVELTARECLNNAIIHGNNRDPDKKVILELRVGKKWIRLRVSDEGPGFNWRGSRQPSEPCDTASNGRGLSILNLYASRIAFNRRGNQISLWLNKEFKGEP